MRLTHDLSEPQRFFSFAPWDDAGAIHAWKGSPEFRERMAKVRSTPRASRRGSSSSSRQWPPAQPRARKTLPAGYTTVMDHVRFSGTELRTLPGLVMTPRPATEAVVATALARVGDRAGTRGRRRNRIRRDRDRDRPRLPGRRVGDRHLRLVGDSRPAERLGRGRRRARARARGRPARARSRRARPRGREPAVPAVRRPCALSRTSPPSRRRRSSRTATGSIPTGGCSRRPRPRLAPDGAVIFQLHREVFVTERARAGRHARPPRRARAGARR